MRKWQFRMRESFDDSRDSPISLCRYVQFWMRLLYGPSQELTRELLSLEGAPSDEPSAEAEPMNRTPYSLDLKLEWVIVMFEENPERTPA